MNENKLLERITVNPKIFAGKAIIRGRRLAVEHVLGMLAAGDTTEDLLKAYPWLEREDIQACLVYARRIAANARIEPLEVTHRRFCSTPVLPRLPKNNWNPPATIWSGLGTGVKTRGTRLFWLTRTSRNKYL